MPPIEVPALDVNAVVAAFDDQVASMPAGDRALARRTLDRVRPPNWTLEWHLPGWLGGALGVPSPIAARAGLSNVLGLVAVRLRDDADDGELPGADAARADRVSAALLERAIGLYRPLFEPGSPFWRDLAGFLASWRAAGRGDDDGSPALAARGAPLKAGARAMTLLGNRPEAWPEVERCLDLALTALALYDDACDWEGDLAAGRWNALVAATAGQPGRHRGDAARTRSRVLLALVNGHAAGTAFGEVEANARGAAEIAEVLGCPPLADHLRLVARRALEEGVAVEAHYAGAAGRMTRLLFEPIATGGIGT